MLVIFGGVTGYSSDDINKFLWPVRIGSGVFPDDMHHEKVSAKNLSKRYTFLVGRGERENVHRIEQRVFFFVVEPFCPAGENSSRVFEIC